MWRGEFRYVTLPTVAMCVGEAFVAGVDTVVHSIADVRRVDALSTSQAVERAVTRSTRSTDHR